MSSILNASNSTVAGSRMNEDWRDRIEQLPGWAVSLAVAVAVALVALAPRVAGLAGATPGFTGNEATNALFARQISIERLPIYFGGETGASGPLFPYIVRGVAEVAGWGVTGPRLAAALLGTAAAVACALWYSRALGRWWGLAGGILIASSFWQVMFGTRAVAPVATTLAAALGLWCLWQGLAGQRHRDGWFSLWYPAAGVAFGLGFYAHLGYLIVPAIVLLSTGYLLVAFRRSDPHLDARGAALMLVVMVLVMTPLAGYYSENTGVLRQEIEQFGEIPETISSSRDDYLAALETIAWRGPTSAEYNLPGRALLDPLLVALGLAGIGVAIRYPLEPLHGLALIWLVFLLMPIALVNPEPPDLYLPLAPVLFAFPLIGINWLARFAQQRFSAPPLAIAGVVAVIVLASAAWSIYDYFWQWADSNEAYEATRGDVREAIETVAGLPDDDIPVYIGAADAERIVRYLAPGDRPIRLIGDRALLPMPADDNAYLAYGRSTAPEALLERYLAEEGLIETRAGPDGAPATWLWILDQRTRERLPYSIPAVHFPNGYILPGYDIQPDLGSTPEEPRVEITLLWRTPSDGDPAVARARLDPPGGEPGTSGDVRIVPWKNNPPGYDELILAHIRAPFPQSPGMTADLLVALLSLDGEPFTPYGPGIAVRADTYAYLNRIGFQAGD